MEDDKTLYGILAMVDIVNFTGQATELGNKNTALYSEYFRQKVTEISGKYGFRVIKSLDDAALLFGVDAGGLLDIMLDLFQRDKPKDNYGFFPRFRMVAHSGFFQFKIENNQPIDLAGAQGIMAFRLEKGAEKWELAVTPPLYDGVKGSLTQMKLEAHRMELREPLKGFDGNQWGTAIYKLRIVKGQETAANLLEPRLNELEKDVQYIPVFGDIYPPVSMETSFITLSLVCHDGRLFNNPDELYKTFRRAIIMGPPGAGKTTLLRNIAYREFKQDETREEGKKQVTLFLSCANAPLYNAWHKQYYGVEPTYEMSPEDTLDYITWAFLLGKTDPGDCATERLAEFRESANRVKRAFKENRVTLLLDALDEAADIPAREKLKEVFITLYMCALQNRLYLTSRPSENIHLAQDIRLHHIPLFNVLPLTLEQVRAVSMHLMEADSEIYKKFDGALRQEEVVVKMAATPIMALLVAAYFRAYEKFDHRYPMYDLLLKFILLRVWENIKTGMFPYKNLELFFQAIKSPDFFVNHKETGILYDALAVLCFNLFYDDVDGILRRSITAEELNVFFATFIKKAMPYQYKENNAESLAAQWREQFHRDHLLLQAGVGKFVFVHSTVMEFLAAYYMVERAKKDPATLSPLVRQCLEKENFLQLETLPIAAGSSLKVGFDLLSDMGKLVNEAFYKDRAYRMGVKCLSEVEWLLQKTFTLMRMKNIQKAIDDMIDRNRHAVRWVYSYLNDTLLAGDKEQLKEMPRQFDSVFKLSRPTFFEEYLDFNEFAKGEPELVDLRKQLLLKVAQKELVETWFEKNQKAAPVFDKVLQVDTPRYHPEDKHFKHYRELIGKELAGFFGSPNLKHSGPVRACAFLLDGKRVASVSEDTAIRLWDVETGKEIRTLSGHTDFVLSCATTPNARHLLSVSRDNTVRLWDVETGGEIQTFTGHTDYVFSCAAAPGGRRLLSASADQTVRFWDVETGMQIRVFSGHSSYVFSCAVTPDGQHLLSASADRTVKLWDMETGREIRTFSGHSGAVFSCVALPDGRRFLSSSADKTVKLWDMETGGEIRTFSGHSASVFSCATAAEGRRFLSASADRTIRLWDLETGREMRSFRGHKAPVYNCAVTLDGRRLVSASADHTLKLWDVETGREVRAHNGHANAVVSCVVTRDGRYLVSASADHTLKLWEVETGREIRSFSGHTNSINGCAVTPDGRRLLSASADHTLRLWDVETGKEIHIFSGHTDAVLSLAAMPDGRSFLSASADKTVKLWDMETGREIRNFNHMDSVNCCVPTGNGKQVVTASVDNTARLWDVESGRLIRFLGRHTDIVTSYAAMPDGRRVLSASADHTIKLWDVETGHEIRTFSGHTAPVFNSEPTADGRHLVSVSHDQSIKLWDMETGQCIKTLELPWIPRYIAISPLQAGKIFTANANGTLTVFEFEELMETKEGS